MTHCLWVKNSQGRYPVFVGEGVLAKIGDFLKRLGFDGKVFLVTQEKAAKFHLAPVVKSLRQKKMEVTVHQIPEGEEAKCERELFRIYHALVREEFERKDLILALGGGVVGDLAGFAAATYLRGIGFANAATTLLAQVDSSIGGKTGINLEEGKNLVGAFYPPRLVVSDVAALSTLPDREFRASMAEVVKYGVIRDARLFGLLEECADSILERDRKRLTKIVLASVRIKAGVVARDEFETKGERMILNFGHTFGHGLEQALHYRKLMHGEAVSIGMACASRLAVRLRLFQQKEGIRLLRLLEKFHLPVSISGLDLEVEDILIAMSRDKKRKGGRLRFVLPTRIGRVVIRDRIPAALVRKILQETGVD